MNVKPLTQLHTASAAGRKVQASRERVASVLVTAVNARAKHIAALDAAANKIYSAFAAADRKFARTQVAKVHGHIATMIASADKLITASHGHTRLALARSMPTGKLVAQYEASSALRAKLAMLSAVAETTLNEAPVDETSLLQVDENGYLVDETTPAPDVPEVIEAADLAIPGLDDEPAADPTAAAGDVIPTVTPGGDVVQTVTPGNNATAADELPVNQNPNAPQAQPATPNDTDPNAPAAGNGDVDLTAPAGGNDADPNAPQAGAPASIDTTAPVTAADADPAVDPAATPAADPAVDPAVDPATAADDVVVDPVDPATPAADPLSPDVVDEDADVLSAIDDEITNDNGTPATDDDLPTDLGGEDPAGDDLDGLGDLSGLGDLDLPDTGIDQMVQDELLQDDAGGLEGLELEDQPAAPLTARAGARSALVRTARASAAARTGGAREPSTGADPVSSMMRELIL